MSIKDRNVLTVGDVVSYNERELIVVPDEYNDCSGCILKEGYPSCDSVINNILGYNGVYECNSTKFIHMYQQASFKNNVDIIVIPNYILKEELCSPDICPFSNNCEEASYCMYKSILNKLKSYQSE